MRSKGKARFGGVWWCGIWLAKLEYLVTSFTTHIGQTYEAKLEARSKTQIFHLV